MGKSKTSLQNEGLNISSMVWRYISVNWIPQAFKLLEESLEDLRLKLVVICQALR